MVFISLLIIFLAVKSISIGENLPYKDGYLIKNTNSVKGILSLCIILCHLTSKVDYEISYLGFSVMGAMGVGAFFFFSGYGIAKSSMKNSSWKEGYWKKRL